MHPDRALERLASVPLLRALPPDRLQTVVSSARLMHARRSEPLYAEGDDGSWIGVVDEGLVRIGRTSHSGRRMVFHVAGPADVFGEGAIFGSLREDRADATDAATFYRLPSAVVRGAVVSWPHASRALAEHFSRRSAETAVVLGDVVTLDLAQLLARRLCEFAERFGRPASGGGVSLGAWITHDDLADIVGASREAVSRTIGQFRDRGCIGAGSGRRLVVHPASLRQEADLA